MLLATKPMQLAQYFCTGEEPVVATWRHYALAMDHYTHFTSPIRCESFCSSGVSHCLLLLAGLYTLHHVCSGHLAALRARREALHTFHEALSGVCCNRCIAMLCR
jgi:hypothetical protein